MLLPSRRLIVCFVWAGVLASPGRAAAATLIFSPLDSLEGWTVRTLGPAAVRIVPGQAESPCVELRSQGGTVFLTRELPPDAVAGCRLDLSCLVSADDVRRGPEVTAAAKLHLALETPRGIRHFTARFSGTSPWHEEALVADVPSDVRRAVLNIGMEACSGRVCWTCLTLRNDRLGVWPLSLAKAANARRGEMGLAGLPSVVPWRNIAFHLVDAAAGENDCVRLRGIGHDDWPAAMAPVSVGRYATAVYLLHAALGGRESAESPCVLWNARLAGKYEAGLSVFEGRDVGALGSTRDLENWKIAWHSPAGSGRAVTLGVTRWPLYLNVPVLTLDCRAYQGAPVLILAATAVEEPPAARPAKSGGDATEAEQ
jgi:hypothetical protein